MFGLLTSRLRAVAPRYRPDEGEGASASTADYRLSGLTAGTRVATGREWRAVERLSVGDRLMTFDNGLQSIVAITKSTHFAAAGDMPAFAVPIHVPIGAIGNDEPLVLLPEQIVMIESDAAEALTGDPFALVPAKALEGFRGIDRIRGLRPVETLTLHFENDEVIFAEGGALLLATATVPGDLSLDIIEASGLPTPYMIHRGNMAREIVAAMTEEDARFFADSSQENAA
jgi:Hint domain